MLVTCDSARGLSVAGAPHTGHGRLACRFGDLHMLAWQFDVCPMIALFPRLLGSSGFKLAKPLNSMSIPIVMTLTKGCTRFVNPLSSCAQSTSS